MRLIVLHTTDEIKRKPKWIIFSHHNLLKNQFIRWPLISMLFYEPSLNNFRKHFLFSFLACLQVFDATCRQKSRTMYNTQVIMTHWCWMKSETKKPNSLFFPFVFEFWKWKRTSETDENGYWAILRFWFYEPYSRISYFDFYCSGFPFEYWVRSTL